MLFQKGQILNRKGGQRTDSAIYPSVLYPVDKSMQVYHEDNWTCHPDDDI